MCDISFVPSVTVSIWQFSNGFFFYLNQYLDTRFLLESIFSSHIQIVTTLFCISIWGLIIFQKLEKLADMQTVKIIVQICICVWTSPYCLDNLTVLWTYTVCVYKSWTAYMDRRFLVITELNRFGNSYAYEIETFIYVCTSQTFC